MEDRELIVKTSAYIDRHRDEMLSLWEKIVSIESGTPDKEGVDRVGAVLKDELESAGVETAVIPMERFGNLLTGVWNKEAAGQPIVLIGHMDTVFAKGTLEKNPFRIDENGNAHGPGVLDMKAGLVIVVYVLKALHEYGYGKRPIRVVFAGDEENGHRQTNAESEIRKLCAGCAAAFNFETGFIDDGLVVGRKGSCRVTLTVHGVAAHAGNDPQRGRNAILEMAHKIIEIQKLHDFEHGLFVNVGVIQGGTVANAVAASCEVGIDIRYDSFERLEETLQAIKKIADMGRFGTQVRGVYGEGAENFGSLYQISNQKTLGQTEREIIDIVRKAALELDAQERRVRREYRQRKPVQAADECYKSYGVLKYARRLTRKDGMEFLSQIMTGITDGILKVKEPYSGYGLMLGIQPANLLSLADRPLDKDELDAARAEFLRRRLPEIIEIEN